MLEANQPKDYTFNVTILGVTCRFHFLQNLRRTTTNRWSVVRFHPLALYARVAQLVEQRSKRLSGHLFAMFAAQTHFVIEVPNDERVFGCFQKWRTGSTFC